MTEPITSRPPRVQRWALGTAAFLACAVILADIVRALSGRTVHWDQILPALLTLVICLVVYQNTRRSTRS